MRHKSRNFFQFIFDMSKMYNQCCEKGGIKQERGGKRGRGPGRRENRGRG